MKIGLLLLMLCGFTTVVLGQSRMISLDSILYIYDSESIHFEQGKYVLKGERYSNGFLMKKYMKAIEESPAALNEIKQYRKKSMIGLGLMLGSIPVGVGTAIATIPVIGPGGAAIAYTAWMAMYLTGVVYTSQGTNHIGRSQWHYNRYILERSVPEEYYSPK
ncbi:MAG: hypothetical protein R2813_12935 [Flavobacteriales bacterium]